MTKIGLVFDFDDTLARDSTTVLLEQADIDVDEFWSEQFQDRVRSGYDPTVAYLSLLIEQTELTQDDLEECAAQLDDSELYPGIPEIFDDLQKITDSYNDVEIEFYIISEGIESLIGHSVVADYCTDVYASRLGTGADRTFTEVIRPISFTDKTRYLYEINKGIRTAEARENPYAVNEKYEDEQIQIAFSDMIYVGDGITDIPCFSLLKERGGRVFGVNNDEYSAKQQAVLDIGSPRRASNLNTSDYTTEGRLGSLLRLTVEGLCTNNTIKQLEAL
jgi:predicted HAD superfamily phosphohydrolase